jgi:regulator of sigma E protease
VFNFAALLSINLGVMNLLPIPALDGGRIVLLILEKIFKGKRWQEISQTLNTAGFIALISLLILITIKDVAGIFFP